MNLKVENAASYARRFPEFRQPTEIGHFSLDSDRNFCNDQHQLKYIVMPSKLSGLDMDLNAGYEEAIRKNMGKTEKIDTLLKWIITHQDEIRRAFRDKFNKLKIDFVCFRGLLTTICATIYENKEDWLICATKYKSVIYLCAFDTLQDIERREKMSEREKHMCAWGYKFEQYMTSGTRSSKPNISVPVNEKEEYCITLKGRLSHHTLLFSAEVDGIDSSYPEDLQTYSETTNRYVELKTSRIITHERQDRNFCRYKLLKWWIQSFLVGIPKIICGFRDDDGIVRDLRTFHIKEIPRIAQGLWSPSAALNFCSQFLAYVSHCVVKDDPHIVYKFYWKPGSDIKCEELTSPGEFQILPEWYISDLRI